MSFQKKVLSILVASLLLLTTGCTTQPRQKLNSIADVLKYATCFPPFNNAYFYNFDAIRQSNINFSSFTSHLRSNTIGRLFPFYRIRRLGEIPGRLYVLEFASESNINLDAIGRAFAAESGKATEARPQRSIGGFDLVCLNAPHGSLLVAKKQNLLIIVPSFLSYWDCNIDPCFVAAEHKQYSRIPYAKELRTLRVGPHLVEAVGEITLAPPRLAGYNYTAVLKYSATDRLQIAYTLFFPDKHNATASAQNLEQMFAAHSELDPELHYNLSRAESYIWLTVSGFPTPDKPHDIAPPLIPLI